MATQNNFDGPSVAPIPALCSCQGVKAEPSHVCAEQYPLMGSPSGSSDELEVLTRPNMEQAEPPHSQLCIKCRNLVNHWPDVHESKPSRRQFPHYSVEAALRTSADRGCNLCVQFIFAYTRTISSKNEWDEGQEPPPGEGRMELTSGGNIKNYRGPDNYWWIKLFIPVVPSCFRLDSCASKTEEQYLQYEVIATPVSPYNITYSVHYDCSNTENTLPLIKRWLTKCREMHTLCHNKVMNPYGIPTRLIDITHSQPHLCLGASLKGIVEHATLSHCWGSPNPPLETLRKDNLQSFLHHIPPEALPKTFRDFIQISRFLGITYVWVDSLCIIQDDKEDWKTESARMTAVYGGSAFNIAASGAFDGSVGSFEFFPLHFDFSHFRKAPLASRGWAVQERLLPRRTVSFCQTQVFWTCNELKACETFPNGYPDGYQEDKADQKLWPITRKEWKTIVGIYSGCSIKFGKDKLVALSGLARLMQEESSVEYLAGLWRKDLEIQLRWEVLNPDRGNRPAEYRAPSWSWASIDGTVRIPKRGDLTEYTDQQIINVTVRKVEVQPLSSENPFGEIQSATLRLRCDYLCGGTLHETSDLENGDTLIDLTRKSFRVSSFLDCSEKFENRRLKVHLLPIYTYKHRFICRGLILQPCGLKKGQYRRIGIFNNFVECIPYEDPLSTADLPPEDDDYAEIYVDEQGLTQRAIDII
ncbi:HET-domain-containing protein [Stipitochalara longipes BDJ]|nr:HET-domain-containing protein [Stipitochalara longipes BDJ]